MQSPITGSDNCIEVNSFDTKKIIKNYKSEFSLNIENYFKDYATVLLYECADTGYRFYYPFDIFGDGIFYAQLNEINKGYYIEKRWEHVQAFNLLEPEKKLLEIGCGDGYFLKLSSKKNIQSTGLEFNKDAIIKGKSEGLNIIDETVEKHSEKNKNTYDYVCFFQVLEHITQVKSFLDAAIGCLKPGGMLIIGVPNNNPYIFKHDEWHTLNLPPHHAGLWNKKSFENLQEYFNIKAENILIEPLCEYKEWFLVQKNYYKKKSKLKGFLLSLIPRPLYKFVLKENRNNIEGRNILATFRKKENV